MKNLIIIIGTIILGCYIFQLIVGASDDSLMNVSKNIMLESVNEYLE